jgi:hypothetical protein
MDQGLVALVVLATFSTVHERLVELIRRTFRGPPEYGDTRALADGFGKGFGRRVPVAPPDQPDSDPGAQLDVSSPSPGLIRRMLPRKKWARWRKALDGMTIGPWSVLIAIALAMGTRASALALFEKAPATAGRAEEARFFRDYLELFVDGRFWLFPRAGFPWRDVVGCVLMGLSTTLGARFWHDLANGLTDLRDRAREVPKEARKMLPPPAAPPGSTVTQAPPDQG